jgi:hypothetical protein
MMKKNNYIIYKAQNELTGEVYIGATSSTVYQRKLDHTERANRGEKGQFQEAIGTYGPEAFSWQQIDSAKSSNEVAEKEKKHILQYNSQEQGYNSDSGGGIKKVVYQYSLEDGSLIAKYNCLQSAANAVDAYKTCIGNACLGQNKSCKGYMWSYSKSYKLKTITDCRKRKVYQYTFHGTLIAEFISVAEASSITGLSKSCISRCCRGERESSGGFIWKYL